MNEYSPVRIETTPDEAASVPELGLLARCAVVFKIYYWDDFVARQFNRLLACSSGLDVFIVADVTHGPIEDIPFPNVVRMTEALSEAEGFLRFPVGRTFWYSTDYQVYHLFAKLPRYDFLITCEHDVWTNVDLIDMSRHCLENGIDFVGDPIRTPMADWGWGRRAQPYYEADVPVSGRLVCFSGYSRRFAEHLASTRRAHTLLAADRDRFQYRGDFAWPNNESFVGTEIGRFGANELPLSRFADVSRYDWAPAHMEAEVACVDQASFIHPVLDGRRYFRARRRLGFKVDHAFTDDSDLATAMGADPTGAAAALFLNDCLETQDDEAIERLRAFVLKRLGPAGESILNVARNRPATQSSTCQWSRENLSCQRDASGGVDGRLHAKYGFHTNNEEHPWWCVDLENLTPIREIRVFNRLDMPRRADRLVIRGSRDMMSWTELWNNAGHPRFGGADGRPLRVRFEEPRRFRFVHLHLPQHEFLHLDQVEVYV